MRPRAISVRRLCQLVDQRHDASIDAALGEAKEPVLLYQGMTPFHPAGERPHGIFGMGYPIQIEGEVSTVAWQPDSSLIEVAKVDQEVSVGLGVGGALGTPSGLEGLDVIPGITLPHAKIHAKTHQEFRLSISFVFNLLRVQAGAVGSGEARWNIYQQDERLDRFQPLTHTLTVPRDTPKVTGRVTTWIRRNAGTRTDRDRAQARPDPSGHGAPA
ncbi:MAG: hypothetical protein JW751_24620 [Polyangiaceae bacterium]|nr:hypothetical protein [Polyangiaceae bacterium]